MEKTSLKQFFDEEHTQKIKFIDGMDFYEPFLKKHFQTTQILTTKINELYKKNQEIQWLNASIVRQIEKIQDDNLNLHSEFRRTYLGMEDKMNYLINEFQNIMMNVFKSDKLKIVQNSNSIPSVKSLNMFSMRKFKKLQKEHQNRKNSTYFQQQNSEKPIYAPSQNQFNQIYSQTIQNQDIPQLPKTKTQVRLINFAENQTYQSRESNQSQFYDLEQNEEISKTNEINDKKIKQQMPRAMSQQSKQSHPRAHPKALGTITQGYIDGQKNAFVRKIRASEGSLKFDSNSQSNVDYQQNISQIEELKQTIFDLKLQISKKFSEIQNKEKYITQTIQKNIEEAKAFNSIELNAKISKINQFIEKQQKEEINTKNMINRMTKDGKNTHDQLKQHIEMYKRNVIQLPKKAIEQVKEWLVTYEKQSHDLIYKRISSFMDQIQNKIKDRVTVAYFHQTMKNLNHSLLEEFAECDNKFAFKRQTKRAFIFIEKKLNKLLEELYEKGQINVQENHQLFEDLYFNVKQYHLQTLKQTQEKSLISTLTIPNKEIPKNKSLQMECFGVETTHTCTPEENPFRKSQKNHKETLLRVPSQLKHEKSLTTHNILKQKHTRAASNYQVNDKFQKSWKQNAQKILEEGPIKIKKRRVFFK